MMRRRTYISVTGSERFTNADARCACDWHQVHCHERTKAISRAKASLRTHARMVHKLKLTEILVVEAA